MKDLSNLAGFPLRFDPTSYALETSDDMPLRRTVRSVQQMRDVLFTPDLAAPETELYAMLCPERLPTPIANAMAAHDLTFSFVLLPPWQIGDEFVKTAGHYHDCIPGTSLGYPEIYAQLYGRQRLFLQKPAPGNRAKAVECVLIDLVPGMAVEVPPSYLHVLINDSPEPALLAGLYKKNLHHDYQPVRAMGGLAYYLLSGPRGLVVRNNTKYIETPPLRRLESVDGSAFAPPEPSTPFLGVYLQRPENYAFLTDAKAAALRYGPLDERSLANS